MNKLKIKIKTKIEDYLEKLGYPIEPVLEPQSGWNEDEYVTIHRFSLSDRTCAIIERSSEMGEKVQYCGPIPVRSVWRRLLNYTGANLDEVLLTRFPRRLKAYRKKGADVWTRTDRYTHIPLMENERCASKIMLY